jgi:carbon starvation protein
MLMESSVAVMAMIAASLIDPGLYYAMNAPKALLGDTFQSAAQAVTNLGFVISPDQLQAAAAAVEEKTLVARTGGAPTLAVGMSEILSEFVGGNGLKAFWYHFAIMFEALFILTTVDAGTRVGRFMLQDALGNLWKPLRRTSWKPGLWATSAIVVLAWGYFLWVGVEDPLGGINQLFPLFGIANQLLAAIALTVGTVILVKSGKLRYAWVTGLPLAWDALVTLTASYQKIFSSDPKLGFFAQRQRFSDALDAGTLIKPYTADQMRQVVTNSTVDGVLSAVFAALVIIVIVNGAVVCVRAVRAQRAGGPIVTSETPFVESHLVAPAGLFPSAQERRELAAAGAAGAAGPDAAAGSSGSRPGSSPGEGHR